MVSRVIVLGVSAFLIWASASCYWYVCKIKDLCTDVPEEVAKLMDPDAEFEEEEDSLQVWVDSLAELKDFNESSDSIIIEVKSPGEATIFFEYALDNIINLSTLEEYTLKLKEYSERSEDKEIYITGHTCYLGGRTSNHKLGLVRARTVKDFFVEKGIPEEVINLESKGESEPIATNKTPKGRKKNRRVEVIVK